MLTIKSLYNSISFFLERTAKMYIELQSSSGWFRRNITEKIKRLEFPKINRKNHQEFSYYIRGDISNNGQITVYLFCKAIFSTNRFFQWRPVKYIFDFHFKHRRAMECINWYLSRQKWFIRFFRHTYNSVRQSRSSSDTLIQVTSIEMAHTRRFWKIYL